MVAREVWRIFVVSTIWDFFFGSEKLKEKQSDGLQSTNGFNHCNYHRTENNSYIIKEEIPIGFTRMILKDPTNCNRNNYLMIVFFGESLTLGVSP